MIFKQTADKRLAIATDAKGNIQPTCVFFLSLLILLLNIFSSIAHADGGSTADPDLQVGGYTVFGTNVSGATVVTSGWGNVYMDGSLQIRSDLHVEGQIVNTNLVRMSRQSLAQHDQWLAQGATIQPTGSYIRVRGEVGPVTLGNPQIAEGQPGQLLILQGISSLLKVQLLNGNGLRTRLEQPFSLGEYDIIQFIYDSSSTNWVEINRSQNRWEN